MNLLIYVIVEKGSVKQLSCFSNFSILVCFIPKYVEICNIEVKSWTKVQNQELIFNETSSEQ